MRIKILKRTFFVKLTVLLLLGCNSPEKISQQVFIDLETKAETGSLKAGDIIKDFKYIKLETTDKSIVGVIRSVIPSKSGFLIWDYSRQISLFDSDGRFISRIGRKGQGPGEYIEINDVEVCEKSNSIFVLDGGKAEILQYSFDNEFLRSIKIKNRSVMNFLKTSFGFICYMDPLLQNKDYGHPVPTLITLDNEGNELNVLHYRTVNLENFPPFIQPPLMKKYKGRYYYYPPLQDTVFSVYQDKIVPEYVLFKGDYSISIEDVGTLESRRKAYQKGMVVGNFVINDNWLLIQCKRNNNIELYYYDLATKKLLNITGKNDLPAILNNIDNSFDIYPINFSDNYLIDFKRADEILEEQQIPEALKGLDEEDNPVIRVSSVLE